MSWKEVKKILRHALAQSYRHTTFLKAEAILCCQKNAGFDVFFPAPPKRLETQKNQ